MSHEHDGPFNLCQVVLDQKQLGFAWDDSQKLLLFHRN